MLEQIAMTEKYKGWLNEVSHYKNKIVTNCNSDFSTFFFVQKM